MLYGICGRVDSWHGGTAPLTAFAALYLVLITHIQVCGEAEVWGDFIVPLPSAHLPGALNVDLDGVFHSPLGEKLPVFGPWYGSEQVGGHWDQHVCVVGSGTRGSVSAWCSRSPRCCKARGVFAGVYATPVLRCLTGRGLT